MIILGAIIVIIIIVALTVMRSPNGSQNGKTSATPQELKGSLVCLPKKGSGAEQTAECSYGLKTGDNKHYALKDSSGKGLFALLQGNTIGAAVTVNGLVSTPPADQVYDIVGTIDATEIKKTEQ